MSVRPSEQQLARAASRLGDPAAGLTAVRELRRRLDTLEAAHVDQAIESRLVVAARSPRRWA